MWLLLFFACRCLLARCCPGRGRFRRGRRRLRSWLVAVVLCAGGVGCCGGGLVRRRRCRRLWCRGVACVGGLRRVGLSAVVSGCRLSVSVAVVGAVPCPSGWAVAVLFVEPGLAGAGRLCPPGSFVLNFFVAQTDKKSTVSYGLPSRGTFV